MSPTVIVRFGALVVVSAGVIFGQGRGSTGTTTPTTGGGTTGSPTTGSTPTTTTPGRTNIPTTTQPQPSQQPERMQQPIFISGRVMLEDGSPAANVVIERVCSGSPHSEGYTDSRGYFSIQLGAKNNAVLHDASEDMG